MEIAAHRRSLLLGISVLWVPLAFLFDGVTVLLLPVRLGLDATSIGLVSFIGLALAAALQPVAGWLSDRARGRLDRRRFVALAALPAIAGLALLAGVPGLWAVVVGYVVVQVAATAIQAGQQTFIPEHIAQPARGRASGFKAAFDVGGAFLAFLVLGAVLATGGPVAAAAVAAVVLVAAVGLVLALVPDDRDAVRPSPRGSVALPPGLAPLVISRFLFLFATYAVGRFLVVLVGQRLGIPTERAVGEAGWLLALFTLATAAAALPLGWLADLRPRRDLMVAGGVVAAVGILLLVPPLGLAGVVVGGLLMSLGTAAFVTANWAATTALVPASDAGRLMGIANLGTGLAAAAAGILGPLIDVAGFAPALLVAAAASGAAAVPLLTVQRAARGPAPENAA